MKRHGQGTVSVSWFNYNILLSKGYVVFRRKKTLKFTQLGLREPQLFKIRDHSQHCNFVN